MYFRPMGGLIAGTTPYAENVLIPSKYINLFNASTTQVTCTDCRAHLEIGRYFVVDIVCVFVVPCSGDALTNHVWISWFCVNTGSFCMLLPLSYGGFDLARSVDCIEGVRVRLLERDINGRGKLCYYSWWIIVYLYDFHPQFISHDVVWCLCCSAMNCCVVVAPAL